MRKITTRQLTFAALFAALAVLLSIHPFTFYIGPSIRITFREVPIYLCSITLGPVLGGLCSFIADTCGTFISNSGNAWNPLFALNAVLIGVLPGLLYRLLPRKTVSIYIALVIAMIAGRIVWGIARLVLAGLTGSKFTWALFMAGAFTNAIPGIILHIVLIPVLVIALERAGLSLNRD